jgi:hypothetical protein
MRLRRAIQRPRTAKENRPFLFGVAGQCPHERFGLDPSSGRRPQRGSCGNVRLALTQKGEVDHLEPANAVGETLSRQGLELPEFTGIRGDYELAAAIVRDVVRLAEPVQPLGPLDAQPRLERARGIVDAGVNDAAVVGAGFHPRTGMLLDVADGKTDGRQFRGRRKARDSAADDQNVEDFDAFYDATREAFEWRACRVPFSPGGSYSLAR